MPGNKQDVSEGAALHKLSPDAGGREALPARGGTYILVLQMAQPQRLAIGRLGVYEFAAGWYCYVGSALGSGGLRGRLRHHLTPVHRPHWHVDYLQGVATCAEVWCSSDGVRREHLWAAALQKMPGARIPAPRFGASDCHCAAHLFHFTVRPRLEVLCDEFSLDTECTEMTESTEVLGR